MKKHFFSFLLPPKTKESLDCKKMQSRLSYHEVLAPASNSNRLTAKVFSFQTLSVVVLEPIFDGVLECPFERVSALLQFLTTDVRGDLELLHPETRGQVPASSHAIYHAFSYSRQSLQLAQRSPSALQLN